MKVLWLCNIILPKVAKELNLKASNKEGWLSGICSRVEKDSDFELAVCFPVPKEFACFKRRINGVTYFGFVEDTVHPECYDASLEDSLREIVDEYGPDVIHIFGTEYPHTLAMCRVCRDKSEKILIGIQGIMEIYKDHYFDGLPLNVINRATFRDYLKSDSLKQQQDKYSKRAINEIEAVKIAGNVTGRTPFDVGFAANTNPNAKYHFMNETLRSEFYEGNWDIDYCEKYSIFLSQGNYPIKGLHVMLEAMPKILKKYPAAKVYVAGDVITRFKSLKDKIKISSYGLYIRELIRKNHLEGKIIFTGSLNAEAIRNRLLQSNVFVCPSSIENSPNSLGEAMILGVPCISSNVGGISGIFDEGEDGLFFENQDYDKLAECVISLFDDKYLQAKFSQHASMHAHRTHNPDINYKRLLEIYNEIMVV